MTNATNPSIGNFPKEAISQQLEKVLQHVTFRKSDILSKFLSFIVEETLSGHSSWLKEYTIGTSVLNKPATFKPHEDGIVRIHAVRLRRALKQYYENSEGQDEIYISIPKGGYVPMFARNAIGTVNQRPDSLNYSNGKLVIGILPFNHALNDHREESLADGLVVLLSRAFMDAKQFSVIAYYSMRNSFREKNDSTSMPTSIAAQYVFAGDIQTIADRVRIFVQLVDVESNKQIWSQMYDRKMNSSNLFELQDEIAQQIILELKHSWPLMNKKDGQRSMMAVA